MKKILLYCIIALTIMSCTHQNTPSARKYFLSQSEACSLVQQAIRPIHSYYAFYEKSPDSPSNEYVMSCFPDSSTYDDVIDYLYYHVLDSLKDDQIRIKCDQKSTGYHPPMEDYYFHGNWPDATFACRVDQNRIDVQMVTILYDKSSGQNFGYIVMNSVDAYTITNCLNIVSAQLAEYDAKGLIVDLRASTNSQSFGVYVDLLSYLLPQDSTFLFYSQTRVPAKQQYGAKDYHMIQGNGKLSQYPVAVIVNNSTAGYGHIAACLLSELTNVKAVIGCSATNGGGGDLKSYHTAPICVTVPTSVYGTDAQGLFSGPFEPTIKVKPSFREPNNYAIEAAIQLLQK